MKLKEFKFYFPKADMSMFREVDGSVVWGDYNDDVEEPSFWDNDEAVFDLHMDFNSTASYYENKEGFFKKFKARKRYTPVVKYNFPLEWRLTKMKVPDIKLEDNKTIDFNNFRIYVNNEDYFVLKDTLPDFGNITKIDWDDSKNVYTLSLKAMYVLSYLGGMSLKNLQSENEIAKSLAYFYFYYHLKKFYNYRDFRGYDITPVKEKGWSLYKWAHHFVWYHSQIHYTPEKFKRTKDDVISNMHRDGNKMRYDVRLAKRDMGKDYLKLIKKEGNGLTKIGQLLLQESNQAYVYCVLGAQAKTRWKIIGDGANSLQTQNVFKSLIDEVIANNNLSMLIKSMRLAIQQTKIRLDFVISPGLELIPSKMVYIKDSVGYNNVLRISSRNLKFGENNVNSEKNVITKVTQKEVKSIPQTSVKNVESNTPILISGALIALFGRLIWIAL